MTGDRPPDSAPSPAPAVPRWAGRLSAMVRADAGRLFVTGVPHLLTAMALTQGIGLVRRVLLARILSIPELGQMTYVMQIADLVAMVADLGLCTAVLKYAAEPIPAEEKRRIYVAGLVWGTLSSVLVTLVYLGAALGTGLAGDEALRVFMAMVAPYIVLSTVVKTPLVFMQAQREIRRASLFTAVTQVVSLVMLVGATWTWGLWGFFATVIAAPLTNLGILLVATRRDLRWTGWPWGRVRKLVGFGIPSMLANTVGFANGAAAVVLLKHLTGSDEWVGLYSIGLVMMSGARLLPSALMGTAFPYLSGLLNDPARFRTRMRELSLKQGAVLLLSAVAWFLVGRQAIIWVFGARFEDAFWSSLILVAGLVPFGLGAPYGNGLMILGRVGLNLLVSTLQLAVNVGLLLVLIPGHPLEGAAWAVSAAQGVGGAATIVAAWWALGKVRPTAPVLPGG